MPKNPTYIRPITLTATILAILTCAPLLPVAFAAKSADIESGRKLFVANKCQVCHVAQDMGGCLAPPLDGVIEYRSRAYIIGRITLGDKFLKNPPLDKELMPHPRLPLSQSSKIASYIESLKAPKGGYKIYGHEDQRNSEEKVTASFKELATEKIAPLPSEFANLESGRKIFLSSGCLACHSVGTIGGHFAPNLENIGSQRTSAYIQRKLTTGGIKYGDTLMSMPPAHLTQAEIDKLAAFLSTLQKTNK